MEVVLSYICTIFGMLFVYAVITGLLVVICVLITDFEIEIENRSVIAQFIFWPLTAVIYVVVWVIKGIIWLVHKGWKILFLGYWDFIKSLPKMLKLKDDTYN